MNKLIILFLIALFILGQIHPILEYFKSKLTFIRKYDNNTLRHFNHIFVALIFIIMAIWFFLAFSEEKPLWANISILLLGMGFLALSFITFALYFNYLLRQHIFQLIYDRDTLSMEINGKSIKRNAIVQVNWHRVKRKKLVMIWSSFEYIELIMLDGTRYIIPSLLLNLKALNKYFQNLPVEYHFSWYPKIRKGLPVSPTDFT